ncbi:MAG: HAD family hydrolase [Eubacterium sp.]|nr:HAD family hydrolase [Eubacterium sp.]
MNRKAVFLDIDGTLTTFRSEFPDSAREALRTAKANGHELVICTGRVKSQIYPWLLETGLFTGLISGSGADVSRMGEQVYQHFFSSEVLKHFLDYFSHVNCYYILQGQDKVFGDPRFMDADGPLFGGDPVDWNKREKLLGKIYRAEDPYKATDIEKACYYRCEDSYQEICRALGPAFDVMGSSYSISSSSDGEVTLHGITKASGIRHYLENVGIEQADSIAVGDSGNDLEMIRYAGTGVAMGNGTEEAKKAADLVTDPIEEDGLYNAFKKLGLI